MNEIERREMLAAIVRHEMFQTRYGENRRWREDGRGQSVDGPLTPAEAELLAKLADEGLVRLPDQAGTQYWDVTEKALEG